MSIQCLLSSEWYCTYRQMRGLYLQSDNINLWYDKCEGKEYYSNSPVDK